MDFSEIYDEHFGRIYAYICCRAGSGGIAEDLAAQVFQKKRSPDQANMILRAAISRNGCSALPAMK